MKNLEQLKAKISVIMDERIRNPINFEAFAAQMLELGVTRLSFDALKNEMQFYTKDHYVIASSMTHLIEAKSKDNWILGDNLDTAFLEKSIQELDAGNISAIEFHRRIYSAAVVYVNVYLIPRRIYYMGLDGQHYLEKY